MEINITSLLETDLFPFSHSRAEGGDNAGRETWNASKQDASERQPPFIGTDEEKDTFRDYVQSIGGWSREEIDGWSDTELNALFLQFVAGDVRQCPALLEEIDFEERWPGMWYFQTPKDLENDMEDGPHDSRTEAYRVASNELVGFNQTRRADSIEEIDWEEYEIQASAGRISGRLFKAYDGQIYYSISE